MLCLFRLAIVEVKNTTMNSVCVFVCVCVVELPVTLKYIIIVIVTYKSFVAIVSRVTIELK